MTEILSSIEMNLLPVDCKFSEEQKEVIYENNSIDVVAGPGTGKTTVLTARIKMLFEEVNGSRKGICVLTHTNVAVDEIKSGLRKLGIDEIKRPHFIGTIQDFFNTFFAKKAFHLLLKDKKIRVVDDDIFREKFHKVFNSRKPSFYREELSLPNPENKKIEWNFNKTEHFASLVGSQGQYKKAFDSSINFLFSKGIITNKCCLELANWYIEKHRESFRKVIPMRFSYLLLDEAQDTSALQFNLISALFDAEKVTIQKFGDPYQSIYNIWGGDTDLAWEIDDSKEKRISQTSRFGESIVNIVKNVCIKKYQDLTSNSNHESFSPYFIIYDNGDDLLSKYNSLIEELETKDEHFKVSRKPKVIASVKHKDLEDTFGVKYKRENMKKFTRNSYLDLFLGVLLKKLSKKFDEDFEDNLKKFQNRMQIFEIIKALIEDENNKLKDGLRTLLDELITNEEFSEDKDRLCTEIIESLESTFSLELESQSSESEEYEYSNIRLCTVHSTKGETHKATLLMLDTTFTPNYGNDSPSYHIVELLKNCFNKEYVELPEEKNEKEIESEKARKLAYVALSRP
ncbi:MAG: UvrD-helicase domain-containing protein, partial [Lactococcus lactis]